MWFIDNERRHGDIHLAMETITKRQSHFSGLGILAWCSTFLNVDNHTDFFGDKHIRDRLIYHIVWAHGRAIESQRGHNRVMFIFVNWLFVCLWCIYARYCLKQPFLVFDRILRYELYFSQNINVSTQRTRFEYICKINVMPYMPQCVTRPTRVLVLLWGLVYLPSSSQVRTSVRTRITVALPWNRDSGLILGFLILYQKYKVTLENLV